MSKKHKKVVTTLNHIKHFLILGSTITGCISISAFASLAGIPIEITSSAAWLKIYAITSGIKNYKSIIKKKKSKLNWIEILISKALIDSVISHDKFVLINK